MKKSIIDVDKLHTTDLGISRIKKNLELDVVDVVEWCKNMIVRDDTIIERRGKNWYVEVENYIITINAYSYTIITAHKRA